MRVAFIGLGNMGGPMAANLVKAGHTVCGYDVGETACQQGAAAGIVIATSAAEAVGDAEAVVTMLPHGDLVLSTYDELLPAAPSGTLFIDSSTIAVEQARTAAERATSAGHRSVDAPVSGGVVGASAGTLTFMVGGESSDLDAAGPLLEAMGGRSVHCGANGAGQAAKLCNNLILAISMVGVSEAFVLGERLGLSNQALFDVASTSSGQCWALTTNCPVPGPVPTSPANREYAAGFANALMNKDLGLAMAAVHDVGLSTPVGELAAGIYASLADGETAGQDFSSVINLIRAAG